MFTDKHSLSAPSVAIRPRRHRAGLITLAASLLAVGAAVLWSTPALG